MANTSLPTSGAIDYTALAKQFGATTSTPPPNAQPAPAGGPQPPPAQSPIDYTALAKQHGAIASTPPPAATPTPAPEQGLIDHLNHWWQTDPYAQALGASEEFLKRPVGSYLTGGKTASQIVEPLLPDKSAGGVKGSWADLARLGAGAADFVESPEGLANVALGAATGGASVPFQAGVYGAKGLSETPAAVSKAVEKPSPENIQTALMTPGMALLQAGAAGESAPNVPALPVGESLKELPGAIADKVVPQPATSVSASPAEKFTPQQVYWEAKDHGIQLPIGQASGNPVWKAADALGQRALIGGSAMKELADANHAGAVQWTSDLQKEVDPNGIAQSTEAVGADLRRQAEHLFGEEQRTSREAQLNPAIAAKVNGAGGVDTKALRNFAGQELFEETPQGRQMTWTPAESLRALREMWNPGYMPDASTRAFQAPDVAGEVTGQSATDMQIKDVLGQTKLAVQDPRVPVLLRKLSLPADPDTLARVQKLIDPTAQPATGGTAGEQVEPLSWRSAVRFGSHLFDQGNDYSGRIPSQTTALYRQGSAIHHTAMEEAAGRAGPDVLQQWLDANAKTRALHEEWNAPGSPLYWTVERGKRISDVQLPGYFLEQGNYGGDPAKIQALKDKGFDLGPLQVEAINRIKDQNFALRRGRLAGYSDDFLKELLPTPVLDDLYKLAAAARQMRFEMNPSGTSNVLLQQGQAGALGGAVAGAAMGHPAAVVAALPMVGTMAAASKIARSEPLTDYVMREPTPRGLLAAKSAQVRQGARLAPWMPPSRRSDEQR